MKEIPNQQGWSSLLGRRRLLTVFFFSLVIGLLNFLPSQAPFLIVLLRVQIVGFGALIAFGTLEQWPRTLPEWLPRWGLQLLGVVVSVPLFATFAYWSTTGANFNFFNHEPRRVGLGFLIGSGVLFGLWIALGAMLRQREAFARSQQLAFDLERSELERQALDARMRLLQAQVQPHFLFNTLANVQALVDAGSPKASQVLGTLIAYLRAAVPRLDEPFTTLENEVNLVRSYLELMHMRMPDRLQFALNIDPEALGVRCPPLTLLTLVENAVRHGIDPSEEGGRIDVDVQLQQGRCRVLVSDTGVGLKPVGGGLGTGLSTDRDQALRRVRGADLSRLEE